MNEIISAKALSVTAAQIFKKKFEKFIFFNPKNY